MHSTSVTSSRVTELLSQTGTIPIISLVECCIEEAHALRASDIHILPGEHYVSIRFRIDGELETIATFPKAIREEVIMRIKVLSRLRTDEHQTAQDGRFRYQKNNENPIDIRVSIMPTYHGENAILRLLTDHASHFTLKTLGFSDSDRQKIMRAAHLPFGMILATGPTGSGKTTTLYTLIKLLNKKETSIITIEDPVEYAIEDITQIPINPRAGLSFANGLRSILRQDPNSIMVGEIRDSETAGIAINTALTGHLILSTIHTSDSATTLPRLLDMGIDSYLVASTVSIAIGQRLVRKICTLCKHEVLLTYAERQNLTALIPTRITENGYIVPGAFYIGEGCEACNFTGFSGRIGIYEVLSVSPRIREAILLRASAADIKKTAIEEGMTTMLEDGLYKAQDGHTTIAEVLRSIYE
ncbi:GspE/PulE family protein [Patescibacteria group bacterium]|nr:GspE/PulE family protein [Patescibacteria group bacterium]